MEEPSYIPPEVRLHRLARADYEEMIERGCLHDKKIELLYGLLVDMSPIGLPHMESVKRLNRWLTLALSDRADVLTQSPFAAADESEPEPDVAVFPQADYSHRKPDHAFLVIEVAESSLAKDRGIKARLYAESGVADYWVVDLAARRVHVYREPAGSGYARITSHAAGEVLHLLAFPDVSTDVAAILPTA